ncbi:hypothetical protein [Jannaschia sp. M317]|nr:hypothetical protein [Jannaschia sp. M317]
MMLLMFGLLPIGAAVSSTPNAEYPPCSALRSDTLAMACKPRRF